MRLNGFWLCVLSVLTLLTIYPLPVAAITFSSVPNGSFETGDTTGWTLTLGGGSEFPYPHDVNNQIDRNLFATNGTFFLRWPHSTFTSTSEKYVCTDTNVFLPSSTYFVSFDAGFNFIDTSNVVIWLYTYPPGGSGGNEYFLSGFYPSIMQNHIVQINSTNKANRLCIGTMSSPYTAFKYSYFGLDNIKIFKLGNLTITTTEPAQPINILTPFQILVDIYDEGGNKLNATDVNSVKLRFQSDANVILSNNGSSWVYNNAGNLLYPAGTFDYNVYASGPYFVSSKKQDQIIVYLPFSNTVSITDVSNVSHTLDNNAANLFPQDKAASIVWKTDNVSSYDLPVNVNYNIFNNSSGGKYYLVYTSIDGENWVFNETATYGNGTFPPMQKVWDEAQNSFKYSFFDNIGSNATKYYKLVFAEPLNFWQYVSYSADWLHGNPPTLFVDINGQNWDVFQDSNYSRINSYTAQTWPDLTSSTITTGFYLIFNGYADAAATLAVGYRVGATGTTTNVNLTTAEQTFAVPIDPNNNDARFLIKRVSGNSATIYLNNYSIVPRSYFGQNLDIFNRDGSALKTVLRQSVVSEYLQEGVPFLFQTSAYDLNGDLKKLRIDAMIGPVVVRTNEYSLTDATSQGHKFIWNEIIDGPIDLNGSAYDPLALRDIVIRATLINQNDQNVAEQTKTYKLLQYPNFPDDIKLTFYNLTAKVGDNPHFQITLEQINPGALIGLKIHIADATGINPDDYNTFISGGELDCNSFICTKDILIDDWVFDTAEPKKVVFQLLTNTENENTTNDLLNKTFSLITTYRTFETARILQVFERQDHTYRNDEPIGLVLQLRDTPIQNLSNVVSAYITADICTASSGACAITGTTKFYPKKFIYDQATGYNYLYFNNLFYEDNGALLRDANYVRFAAVITDARYSHSALPVATLGDKCASASWGTAFNPSWFNMNIFLTIFSATERALYGCGTDASAVIEVGDGEEQRILIDADHDVNSEQNSSIACIKLDENNYRSTLEQQLVCGVMYKMNEQQLDKFVFTLGNSNSDYSKSGSEAQYLTFEVPAEEVIFNDAFLMQNALRSEYQTDTIDNWGELFFLGADKVFSGIANPLTGALTGFTKSGLITNVGFDINWDKTFDPNYLTGLYFFKIEGLKVINQYNFVGSFPTLKTLDPKYFKQFATDNKLDYSVPETIVRIYTNDLRNLTPIGTQIGALSVPSPIIIYETPSKGADVNAIVVPTKLYFTLTSDMLSGNFMRDERKSLPLTFTWEIPAAPLSIPDLINDILWGQDENGNPNGLLNNPAGFVLKYWFWLTIIVCAGLLFSLIFKNLRGGGGITINNGRGVA